MNSDSGRFLPPPGSSSTVVTRVTTATINPNNVNGSAASNNIDSTLVYDVPLTEAKLNEVFELSFAILQRMRRRRNEMRAVTVTLTEIERR